MELMLDPPLGEELHPVVHPPVGLRRVPARVVHREPKLAGLSLGHRGRRLVHHG